MDNLQTLFKNILGGYLSRPKNVDKESPIFQSFEALRDAIQEIHPVAGIRVKNHLGQGNWSACPSISFNAEGDNTPGRPYICIIFRDDMSGFYLFLGHGTRVLINKLGDAAGRGKIKEMVLSSQRNLSTEITKFNLATTDPMVLSPREKDDSDYVLSCITYKFYPADSVPSEEKFLADLKVFFALYDKVVALQKNPERKMFSADSFNAYVKSLETKFFVRAEKGRYLEFWSENSRSGSMFVIGYDHIASACEKILETFVADSSYATYVEKKWRDLHPKFTGNPVFQSLLLAQTANTFNVLSKLIHWANDIPAASYVDSQMPLEKEKVEKTLEALKSLHNEGHSGTTGAVSASVSTPAGHGINLVVYGAPGAGKSYYIDEMTKGKTTFRTVFHPEYQNSDFIGGLRPSKDGRDISYSFIPGPFTNALLHADQNPGTDVYLVIEELNRANAAAVFGEVFQLLDRNGGTSEYSISPDETWRSYLEGKYKSPSEVRIPANLHILATMNSSDQGVFQLDTAFKRRWQFHYCRIDFDAQSAQPSFTTAIIPYQGNTYSWTDFAVALNDALKSRGIEEDRLVGPFFLSNAERKDTAACKKSVAGKLLIYLWDDVLRHDRKGFFKNEIRTFSDLVNAYENGEPVFHASVEERFPAAEVREAKVA